MLTKYVVAGQPATITELSEVKPLQVEISGWLIALLFGAFIFPGPFIWTYVGRKLAVAPIAKAAKVSTKKVEKWLESG